MLASFALATVIEEGNGERPGGRCPAPSSPLNRLREITLHHPHLIEQKTSLRTARSRPGTPTSTPQTTAPPAPPARFTLEHAAQNLTAQGTTETPRVVLRTSRKQHVTTRPLAGTQRNSFALFE